MYSFDDSDCRGNHCLCIHSVRFALDLWPGFSRSWQHKGTNGASKGYNRLSSYSGTSEESQEEKSPNISPVKAPPRPSVTWADLNQPQTNPATKPRSMSCPPPRTIVPTVGQKEPDVAQKHAKRKRSKTESNHVCQIQFSISYNFYHSKLSLKLICASHIPCTFGVTYGSYIKAELLPSSEKLATKIQFHTNNPVYDETVEFPSLTYDELLNKSLQLRLFTLDRFSRSCLVGRIVVPFAEIEIVAEKPAILWRTISLHSSQVRDRESLPPCVSFKLVCLFNVHIVRSPHCAQLTLCAVHIVRSPHCAQPTLCAVHIVRSSHCAQPLYALPSQIDSS